MVAGHSLGEFSALVANGTLQFEDGLRLVAARSNAMQAACEENPGTMAAVLGLEDEMIESICNSIKDEVVIAAPYWDMSFPSLLKLFIEQICVNRLTFGYSETGRPYGIVNMKNVVYVTTAGGSIGNANFGFDYIKGVFSSLFGIDDITFLSAEGVDIYGNDPELILLSAIDKAVEIAAERTRNI
jgi:FMN-dependent NADH-azoreductase